MPNPNPPNPTLMSTASELDAFATRLLDLMCSCQRGEEPDLRAALGEICVNDVRLLGASCLLRQRS